MWKTRITELLGIEYPIIGGTMTHISKSKLTAAISEGGGLGILASTNYATIDDFRAEVIKTRELTSKPFAVNLNLFPARKQLDQHEVLDVLIEQGVRIVETSGHKAPVDLAVRVKKQDMVLMHKCVAPRYAIKAQEIGADAVTVVGWENGGATGRLDIATSVLVPRTVDSVNIPVIGGGGVADGRGVAAILALGAEGVIMGTAFMAAEEAGFHPAFQEAMYKTTEADTTLVMRTINNTHRVMKSPVSERVLRMESENASLEELLTILIGENTKKLMYEGDLSAGVVALGQGIGLIRKTRPAAKIIADAVTQAEQVFARLQGVTA